MRLRPRTWLLPVVLVATLGLIAALLDPGVSATIEFSAAELATIQKLADLPAPPPSPTNRFADDPRAAEFGRQLFFEPRLSANGQISCATCHDPAKDFTDGRTTARGLADTTRNTPTILNAAHGFWSFWDGRADSLWAQALGPIESPAEMGSSRGALWQLIHSDSTLRAKYEKIFSAMPELETKQLPPHAKPGSTGWDALPIGDRQILDRFFANLGKAIEAFERTVQSSTTPFDEFARGLREGRQDLVDELSPAAQRGLKTFVGRGQCTLCHFGPNFSDGEFHNIGFAPRAGQKIDIGRYDGVKLARANPFRGTGPHSDDTSEAANQRLHFVALKTNNMGEFKTPTLRNLAGTAPYMHDGRFADLREVLRYYSTLPEKPLVGHMEESLIPLELSKTEVGDLVAFLSEGLRDLSDTRFPAPR